MLTGYQVAASSGPQRSLRPSAGHGLCAHHGPAERRHLGQLLGPDALSDTLNQFFVLGYPGVTFDGRTMAYIVPSNTFTRSAAINSGLFENDGYTPEPGESGGPVYVYDGSANSSSAKPSAASPTAAASSTRPSSAPSTAEANQFLSSAEYGWSDQ